MKIFLPIVIILVVCLFFIAIYLYKSPVEINNDATALKVAVTIFPVFDIVKNIAGDKAEVVLILPSGASPHTFELTPDLVLDLQNTEAVFSIGYGLDNWSTRVIENIPNSQLVNVSSNVNLIQEEEVVDPHYWLSIKNAKTIAQNISDKLSEIDPENYSYYSSNLVKYYKELNYVDEEIKSLIRSLANKNIITMHEGWSYFADEYELNVVGSFEPTPGVEPSPKDLMELSKLAKENDIKVIFSEPQLSNQVLIPFLNDYNLALAILDPIGGLVDRNSYINLMLYNGRTIYESLR